MSALDDTITAVRHLAERLDASRSAGARAVEATSDALDAATAFGAETHIATLVQVHDDLAEATQTVGAADERARSALDRLVTLRGDGGGVNASSGSGRANRSGRARRRSSGGAARSRATGQGDAGTFGNSKGGWRSWGEPSDHVATFSPKVIAYGGTLAGVVGWTSGVLAGVATATGVLAADVTATIYEKRKAAKRHREKGD